jgi:imidazolonepropionase-like amidohydrolase
VKRLLLAFAILAAPANSETIAVVGAKAWTNLSDKAIENATVVISGERIVSVTAGGAAPANARVIDGHGKVLTPSLDAAATQIGLVELASADDTDDRAVASGPLGAAFDVSLAIDANDLPVQKARVEGLSRAMIFPGPAGGSVFAGQGARLHLVQGADILSRSRAAMFVVMGGKAADVAGGSRGASWSLLRNALTEARAYRAGLNTGRPRDQLINHLDADALLPVLDGKIPLGIFAEREADIRQAIALKRDFRINIVIVGGSEAWRVASLLASAAIPVIVDPLDQLPDSFDTIGARHDDAAILARAGVTIGFWVSAQTIYLSYNVAQALREGAGLAVANGLPYAQALRTITQAPARIWGDPVAGGTIAPGGLADLVLWDGDPLEPATLPVETMVAGKLVSPETHQTLLRDRYRPDRIEGPVPPGYR